MSAAIVRHVTITGRVQGVGYRAWVSDEAMARGIAGWVRNRRDGSVEAVFSGDEQNVAAMIAACRRGPPLARVTSVVEGDAGEEMLALRGGDGFAMLPTI